MALSPPASPPSASTMLGAVNSSPSRSTSSRNSLSHSGIRQSRSVEWDALNIEHPEALDEELAAAAAGDGGEVDHSQLRTVTPTQQQMLQSIAMHNQQMMREAAAAEQNPTGSNGSAKLLTNGNHSDESGSLVTGGDVPLPSTLPAVHKSSVGSSVFVLSATTLGAGILALPYAMSLLGWLFGSILLVAVGLTSSYSIRLLLESARIVGAISYEELGHAVFPRFGRRLVVSLTLVLIFGSLTAFFVIIADTITPSLQNIVGNDHSWYTHREFLLTLVAIVIVFPLCLLRSIHALERWSFLAVGIIFGFSLLVIIEAIRSLHNGSAGPDSDGNNPDVGANVKLVSGSWGMFEALPIICLAFTCQTMIFPIWQSLRLGPSVPHTGAGAVDPSTQTSAATGLASSGRMWRVVNWALVLCSCLYLPVGILGFFDFGLSTKGDVLNNYPESAMFYDFVRLGFTLAICIHYPIVHFGFRMAILSTWYGSWSEQENRKRFMVITVATVICSLLLALALPNLSTVFGLTGALCAFPYCFMFPTLFYLRIHQKDSGAVVLRSAGGASTAAEAEVSVSSSNGGGSFDEHGYSPLSNGAASMKRSATASPPSSVVVVEVTSTSSSTARANGKAGGLYAAVPMGSVVDAGEVTALRPALRSNSGFIVTQDPAAGANTPLLLGSGSSSLSRGAQIPAYALLGLSSILWIISIVVCFKDMVHTFSTDGV